LTVTDRHAKVRDGIAYRRVARASPAGTRSRRRGVSLGQLIRLGLTVGLLLGGRPAA